MKRKYTAVLEHNLRGVGFKPMMLLRGVTDSQGNEVRDHMWVSTEELQLERVRPTTNRYHNLVEFEAQESTYLKRGVEEQLTFKKIRKVKTIGKGKK